MPIPLMAALPLVFEGIKTAARVTEAGMNLAGDNAQKAKLAEMKAANSVLPEEGPPPRDIAREIGSDLEEAKLVSLDVPEELE